MLSYEERLKNCNNAVMKKLFEIIISKKSNLCIAANFKTLEECLRFVDKIGQHICILKTQTRKFKNTSPEENLKLLYEKKKKYNFLLFEDDKYNDSPDTNAEYYQDLCVKYVDLITVHGDCGDDTFTKLAEVVLEAKLPSDEPRGCLVVCETSYQYNMNPNEALAKAESNPFCVGIIAQKLQVKNPYNMFKATPGVHLSKSASGSGQNWNHPNFVIGNGADVIIVGRGIIAAPEEDLEKITINYKEVSYKAYLDKLANSC